MGRCVTEANLIIETSIPSQWNTIQLLEHKHAQRNGTLKSCLKLLCRRKPQWASAELWVRGTTTQDIAFDAEPTRMKHLAINHNYRPWCCRIMHKTSSVATNKRFKCQLKTQDQRGELLPLKLGLPMIKEYNCESSSGWANAMAAPVVWESQLHYCSE